MVSYEKKQDACFQLDLASFLTLVFCHVVIMTLDCARGFSKNKFTFKVINSNYIYISWKLILSLRGV